MPAIRRVGLQGVAFHDLRHTYAALMIEGGMNAPQRRDAGSVLGGFPVAVAEVVQIEVSAAGRGKQKRALSIGWQMLERSERGRSAAAQHARWLRSSCT
jgi:hypothetical protein